MKKTTASLLLALLCICGTALAQSDSAAKCTNSDKKAAKELARNFFHKYRKDHDLGSIRDKFVATTARCGSLFSPDPVEIDSSVRKELGCAPIEHLQDGIFDFMLLELEYQLGAEKGILEDAELFDTLPASVKAVAKENPFWAKMYVDRDSANGKISSLQDFETASRGIDEMKKLMRQYFQTHPEYRQRAATRLQQFEKDFEDTYSLSRIDCTISGGESFYHAPKGASVIFTDLVPLPFQVTVILDDGQLKISSVIFSD